MTLRIRYCAVAAALSVLFSPMMGSAEMSLRKIGEFELPLFGVAVGLDPVAPVVPKGVASGVRVAINVGGRNYSAAEAHALLDRKDAPISVEGVLSGPGLSAPMTLTGTDATAAGDGLLLPLPPFPTKGEYTLSN